MSRPFISLCMIVKNEAERIAACLQSARDVVDEIIITDTGSTDRTMDICRSMGAAVYSYEWDDSFANARNAGIARATGQWILWLDGDEELDHNESVQLREFVKTIRADTAALKVLNEMDGFVYSCSQIRLFRNDIGYQFVRDIHERLQPSAGKQDALEAPLLPVTVHHYGYTEKVVEVKEKSKRNIRLLEQEKAQEGYDPWCDYHLASEYSRLQQWERAFELNNLAITGFLEQGKLPPALVYKLKYDTLIRHGSLKGIWPGIDKVLQLYPDYVDLYFYKALYLLDQGLLLEAYYEFEKCTRMGDNSWKYVTLRGVGSSYALYYMSICLAKMGRPVEAQATLEAAEKGGALSDQVLTTQA
ncbi:glycosyltransferase family 2 protein [Paenibacillus terrae]|uniref:glycosyltransferase family 2 protein n=1 Tax=Paenibacillus terrae TaxID=159743 RepID=UPI0005CBBA58|nr:glycosyltransferase family 2 protein [Paenibacillus terrae]